MVFCNVFEQVEKKEGKKVTILILIDGFLQSDKLFIGVSVSNKVTILILIDGFLQYKRKN